MIRAPSRARSRTASARSCCRTASSWSSSVTRTSGPRAISFGPETGENGDVSDSAFTIRRAAAADAPALGRLGALLLRTHHDFDQQRFLVPGDAPEDGYAWFLRGQLRRKGVVIFVAELKETGAVAGYVYAGIEPMSWKE